MMNSIIRHDIKGIEHSCENTQKNHLSYVFVFAEERGHRDEVLNTENCEHSIEQRLNHKRTELKVNAMYDDSEIYHQDVFERNGFEGGKSY